jgi:hypothetical protein
MIPEDIIDSDAGALSPSLVARLSLETGDHVA